jgi:hypothetical protein
MTAYPDEEQVPITAQPLQLLGARSLEILLLLFRDRILPADL